MIVLTRGKLAAVRSVFRLGKDDVTIGLPHVAATASRVYERLRKRAYRERYWSYSGVNHWADGYLQGAKDALQALVGAL